MKLKLDNIGKLDKAEVEINTITLIAGHNSTGKSTVGKLLYCIFNSFYNFEENAKSTMKKMLKGSLRAYFNIFNLFKINRVASRTETILVDELYDLRKSKDTESLDDKVMEILNKHKVNDLDKNSLNEILELLKISNDEIYHRMLQKKFDTEFHGQIHNIFSSEKKSSCILTIKDMNIKVSIHDNLISDIKNFQNLKTEVIYIDNPFILDNLSNKSNLYHLNTYGHKEDLIKKLSTVKKESDMETAIHEIINSKKLKNIYEKFNSICNGNIVYDFQKGFYFKYGNSNKSLDIYNLSAGFKMFLIIQTLLLNGSLENNGSIILDEPEIHLHPQWQKVFAEIIVLLQKEFNLHILINSHSPYFITAIDVYSQKYGIRDSCKFYLTGPSEDGYSAILKDVSNNLEPINKLLYTPFQELENERSLFEEEYE